MTDPQQTADTLIAQLTRALEAIEDPTQRALATGATLKSVPTLQSRLREIRQGAAQALRDDKASFGDIAKALGVTRARAAQIVAGQTSRAAARPPAE